MDLLSKNLNFNFSISSLRILKNVDINNKILALLHQVQLITEHKDTKQVKILTKEFVNERVRILDKSSKPKFICTFTNSFYKGYINSNSVILNSSNSSGNLLFSLNDNGTYTLLIKHIKEINNTKFFDNSSQLFFLCNAIQKTLTEYFKNTGPGTEIINRYNAFLNNNKEEIVSIKRFKSQNLAVCLEVSSLAQNLLSFLNIESYLVLSKKCWFQGCDNAVGHAYNIVNYEGNYFIFDAANPVNICGIIYPAIFSITKDEFYKIKHCRQVAVDKTISIPTLSNIGVKKSCVFGGRTIL